VATRIIQGHELRDRLEVMGVIIEEKPKRWKMDAVCRIHS